MYLHLDAKQNEDAKQMMQTKIIAQPNEGVEQNISSNSRARTID